MKNPFGRLFARKPQVVEPTPDPIVLMLPPRSRVVLEGTVIDPGNGWDTRGCEQVKDVTCSSESWFQRLNRKGRRAGKRAGQEIQDWWQRGALGKTALNLALFCLQLLLWLCYLLVFLWLLITVLVLFCLRVLILLACVVFIGLALLISLFIN